MEKDRRKQPYSESLGHIRSSGSGWILLGMLVVLAILILFIVIKG